jgi:hypothetical protein
MSAKQNPAPRRKTQDDLETIEDKVRKDAMVDPKRYAQDSEVPEGGE